MTGLGLRLATRGGRARIAVTAVALAFAVAFLLAALGALPARQAKLDRLAARDPVHTSRADTGGPGLLLEEQDTTWFGHPVVVFLVSGTSPVPPGLSKVPAPGEVAASPELAHILRSDPHRSLLVGRVPGRVTQVIAKRGLTGPHELFAYVGVASTSRADWPVRVQSFGRHLVHEPAPQQLRRIAWLGAIALLLPVLVLVATATRLSSAARDRRLAAVRLVGATGAQARRLVAVESLLVGVLGVVLGVTAFFSLRGFAASLLPLPDGLYAEDLAPSARSWVLVLLGVPVLAVLTSLVAMRRVVLSPLAVGRRARVRRAGPLRLVPLLAGLGLLVLMALRASDASGPSSRLLLGGGALTILGLAVAAPAVARLVAGPLARHGGPAATLAGRRVAADPAAAGRIVTGTVLVVFVGAWLLAFLPVLGRYNADVPDQFDGLLPGDTVLAMARPDEVGAVLRAVATVPGTAAVALEGAQLAPRGADSSVQVTVASCAALAKVMRHDLGCNGSLAYRVESPDVVVDGALPVGKSLGVLDQNNRRVASISLPSNAPTLHWPRSRAPEVASGGWLVEPRALPARALHASGSGVVSVLFPGQLVVRQEGGRLGAERIRALLPLDVAATTLDEAQAARDRVYLGYLRAARIGVGLAIVVGALSLLVATVDGVRERRRGLAALVAFGTPMRVLRRSVLAQIGAPLLANVLVALAAAAVASWAYLSTDQALLGPVSLPWGSWALIGLAGVAAVALASAVALPFLRAVGRPEALRTE